jgi:hypothetical protein
MANNSENTEWNLRYGGSRVPVNDTDEYGAPFALGSSDEAWKEGSANKAVYDTITMDNSFPEGDDKINADAGNLDLRHLALYVNPDMLYGYKGDAKSRVPGDQMSYRGYPTQVVNTFTFDLFSGSSGLFINFDGSSGAEEDSIVLVHTLAFKHKLPYDTTYTVEYLINSVSQLKMAIVVGSGKVTPTSYSITELVGVEVSEPVSLPLVTGEVFFSLPIVGLTGDQTFEFNLIEFSSGDPYYGTITDTTTVVTEDTYSQSNNNTELGMCRVLGLQYDPTYILNTCSEVTEYLVGSHPGVTLYRPKDVIVQVGAIMYSDVECTQPAPANKYMWADYSYTVNDSHFYRVVRFMEVGSQGEVVKYYPNISTVGSKYCAVAGTPSGLL